MYFGRILANFFSEKGGWKKRENKKHCTFDLWSWVGSLGCTDSAGEEKRKQPLRCVKGNFFGESTLKA